MRKKKSRWPATGYGRPGRPKPPQRSKQQPKLVETAEALIKSVSLFYSLLLFFFFFFLLSVTIDTASRLSHAPLPKRAGVSCRLYFKQLLSLFCYGEECGE